jgi:L-serine dehydratase
MAISVFDMFTIGIGPSSSHTVGPMKAARRFALALARERTLERTASVRVELYGSLGHTGKGHGSDTAVLLGLEGEQPDRVDVDAIPSRIAAIDQQGSLSLLGQHRIALQPAEAIVFLGRQTLPHHPNGMRLFAFDEAGQLLCERTYYSIGGGFVIDDSLVDDDRTQAAAVSLPHPFSSGNELLEQCRVTGLSISALMRQNETVWRSEAEISATLATIWKTMQDCVERGCRREGVLPGGLAVKRRAASFARRLRAEAHTDDPLRAMDWVNLYALAVNEENAAGGRVVTAPTNGAAGIIPAVLHYYDRFYASADRDGIERFLLTAGAIGIIYKTRASISGAEVGCQGEVGVACSMAAAGLAEALGGSPSQVECAAEIGMEHNLGLTCDPVRGLVQVPCIERNAMGAVKAINAARLALRGDGSHKVSLDEVIETMRQTGADMHNKYKETARGGLAVNIVEC